LGGDPREDPSLQEASLKQLLPGLVIVWLLTAPTGPESLRAQDPSAETGFKTAHIFDLKSPEAERDLVQVMSRFNALFEELGYPECRYHLWKLESEGELPSYLWESTWPSRAVYDEVHALDSFDALLREAFIKIAVLLRSNHKYGQYREIPIGSP